MSGIPYWKLAVVTFGRVVARLEAGREISWKCIMIYKLESPNDDLVILN